MTTAKLGAVAAVFVGIFAVTAAVAGFMVPYLINVATVGAVGVALGVLASRKKAINQNSATYGVRSLIKKWTSATSR